MAKQRSEVQDTKPAQTVAADPLSNQAQVKQQPANPAQTSPPEQTQLQTDPPQVNPPENNQQPADQKLTDLELEKLAMLGLVLDQHGLTLQPELPAGTDQTAPVDLPADPPAEKEVPLVTVPTVGRIVHFHLSNHEVRPAMIVNVQDVETVDLQVFTNNQADRQFFPERTVQVNVRTGADHHSVPSVVHRSGVLRGHAPGHWSWPARS